MTLRYVINNEVPEDFVRFFSYRIISLMGISVSRETKLTGLVLGQISKIVFINNTIGTLKKIIVLLIKQQKDT